MLKYACMLFGLLVLGSCNVRDKSSDDKSKSDKTTKSSLVEEAETGANKTEEDDEIVEKISKGVKYDSDDSYEELPLIATDEEFDKGFQFFLQEFTKNRRSQVALFYKPFRYSYLDVDDYETYLTIWKEKDIDEHWGFWGENYFFRGERIIENQPYVGVWYGNKDVVLYHFYIPESGYNLFFIFKKINEKWWFFEFRDWAM